MNPYPMPCEMEYVNGIPTATTNAGSAVSTAAKSTRVSCLHMRKPTAISAGAVAAAGTMPASGAAKAAAANSAATIRLCRPVRAPSATPAADSM